MTNSTAPAPLPLVVLEQLASQLADMDITVDMSVTHSDLKVAHGLLTSPDTTLTDVEIAVIDLLTEAGAAFSAELAGAGDSTYLLVTITN